LTVIFLCTIAEGLAIVVRAANFYTATVQFSGRAGAAPGIRWMLGGRLRRVMGAADHQPAGRGGTGQSAQGLAARTGLPEAPHQSVKAIRIHRSVILVALVTGEHSRTPANGTTRSGRTRQVRHRGAAIRVLTRAGWITVRGSRSIRDGARLSR
jgi:hypothetical protein